MFGKLVGSGRHAHDPDVFCRLFDNRPISVFSATAIRWLSRIEAALATLVVNPQRCTLAPENDAVEEDATRRKTATSCFSAYSWKELNAPFQASSPHLAYSNLRGLSLRECQHRQQFVFQRFRRFFPRISRYSHRVIFAAGCRGVGRRPA